MRISLADLHRTLLKRPSLDLIQMCVCVCVILVNASQKEIGKKGSYTNFVTLQFLATKYKAREREKESKKREDMKKDVEKKRKKERKNQETREERKRE